MVREPLGLLSSPESDYACRSIARLEPEVGCLSELPSAHPLPTRIRVPSVWRQQWAWLACKGPIQRHLSASAKV